MKFNKKQFLKDTILGIAGLLAFTIISFLVFLIGIVFRIHSLHSGFYSEVILLLQFPLFFIMVAVIKIFIGGKLIEDITRAFSKVFRINILAEKERCESRRGKRK
jgi:hypothetical protein